MRFRAAIASLITLFVLCGGEPSEAQDTRSVVQFPSLDDNGSGRPATMLAGRIIRSPDDSRHPALVFLHGCGGLIGNRGLDERAASWAGELNRLGYAVLMVDSYAPRGIGSTCSLRVSDPAQWMNLMQRRERDAYGALQFLRAQPFVRPDRIGMIGWSQGGGVVLLSTRVGEAARLNGPGNSERYLDTGRALPTPRPHVRLSAGRRPVSQYAGDEDCAGLAGAEPHA